MNIRKFAKKAFIGILTVAMAMCFVCTPVSAATKSTLKSQQSSLQKEIAEAQKKLKELKAENKDQLAYLDALEAKMGLVQQEITELETQISDLKSQIGELTAQITNLQLSYDTKLDEYCKRVRAMYVSGSVTELEIIMDAKDMSDLLVRTEMLQQISEKDGETLNELIKSMEEIKAKQAELSLQKETLDESLTQVNANKQALVADEEEVKVAIAKITEEAENYSEDINANQEELAQVNNDLHEAASSYSGEIVNGSGQFTHPCPNYRAIGGGYPNYKSGAYHGGIDFSASIGTPIYAADSGTVIQVNYLNNSYGYHLMIAHGNQLYTLYAHTSEIYVTAGQNVEKGQKIAAVGSTGNSSGPHLHFEVRAGGSRYKVNNVNPLSYL